MVDWASARAWILAVPCAQQQDKQQGLYWVASNTQLNVKSHIAPSLYKATFNGCHAMQFYQRSATAGQHMACQSQLTRTMSSRLQSPQERQQLRAAATSIRHVFRISRTLSHPATSRTLYVSHGSLDASALLYGPQCIQGSCRFNPPLCSEECFFLVIRISNLPSGRAQRLRRRQ